jgi:secondary thiamine-phosphate synthase enzyme
LACSEGFLEVAEETFLRKNTTRSFRQTLEVLRTSHLHNLQHPHHLLSGDIQSCQHLIPQLDKPDIREKNTPMKSLTRELWMNVPQRRAIVSIHDDIERLVAESGVQDGLVLVNAMHITASVFINDNEPGLHRDYDKWLEELAPFDPSPQRYHHNRTGEDNADAHHKRQIMGREVVVAITDGRLHLGPWEHIFYYEFDGKRKKRVLVKIIGE